MNQLTKTLIAVAIVMNSGIARTATAQSIDAQLSTREAYVGMPVVFQVSINNAADFEQPVAPEIDGCDVRTAGAPAQSSQITIINGRRSESRSVRLQYLITPRREGTFEIPPLTIKVDGRDQKTQSFRFVAKKSEAGDLLFVEIEGSKKKVFVGQPLALTLKIWIKPFVDRENKIKLSEANMWQLISEQSSWGGFSDRIQELAQDNQRPAGNEVLRDNGQGSEGAYYLYEIVATVYPQRPGKIDAKDVQIVVSYPTALGRSRDPFESFFGGSPFGGGSRLSQMMDDDFFASSPFGNRLSVTSSRPVVGEADVDSTEVVPVPTAGRPADYRGAVGRYKIVTQATPTAVSAGDPITLNIGIAGTGPMELVQAPPLSELKSLTDDFKVADQSLAGFVQDETKVFSTTIRPRRAEITTIPPIPFSFFDPDSEKFETVMSDPISVTVNESESLALDAIVGGSRRSAENKTIESVEGARLSANFTNDGSVDVLVSQLPPSTENWWLGFVILPPFVWLTVILFQCRNTLMAWLPRFRTAHAQYIASIDGAENRETLDLALIDYIARVTGQRCRTSAESVGSLRTIGLYQLANNVEVFFQGHAHSAFNGRGEASLLKLQSDARDLGEEIKTAFAATKNATVRRTARGSFRREKTSASKHRRGQKAIGLLVVVPLLGLIGERALATDTSDFPQVEQRVELTDIQRKTVLAEAGEIYRRGSVMAETDSIDAIDSFTLAAEKYQLLVDSGVRNAGLFLNLGNAYLQSDQLGRAIANYERAVSLRPNDQQIIENLKFAKSRIKGEPTGAKASTELASEKFRSLPAIVGQLKLLNERLTSSIGTGTITAVLACSSLVFWGLLIVRALGYRFPVKRLAMVPFGFLFVTAASLILASATQSNDNYGIIIVDKVTLYAADGEQFEDVLSIDSSQGHRVEIISRRGDWIQVRTVGKRIGWAKKEIVESAI